MNLTVLARLRNSTSGPHTPAYLFFWAFTVVVSAMVLVALNPARPLTVGSGALFVTVSSLLGVYLGHLLFTGQRFTRERLLNLAVAESPLRTLLHWLVLLLCPASVLVACADRFENGLSGWRLHSFAAMGLGMTISGFTEGALVLVGIAVTVLATLAFVLLEPVHSAMPSRAS